MREFLTNVLRQAQDKRAGILGLHLEQNREVVGQRPDERRDGDGQDPGPDNAPGDGPADSGRPLGDPDPRNRSGDDMGGRNGYAEERTENDGYGAGGLRAEPVERFQLGHPQAHGPDHPPSTEECPQADGGVTHQDNPGGDLERFQKAAAVQDEGDDADGLLGVIRAVAQAEHGGGDELQPFEIFIEGGRTVPFEDPEGQSGEQRPAQKPEDGCNENEQDDNPDAAQDQRLRTDSEQGGADQAQRVADAARTTVTIRHASAVPPAPGGRGTAALR